MSIVNDAARLVSQQIRVNIERAKRPRALGDEAPADRALAKGKVTRAGIENHIHCARGEAGTRPVRHPGVLADFKADADAGQIENQISDRQAAAAGTGEVIPYTRGPRLEPAWLVVNAVPRKIALRRESENPAIGDECADIEERPLMEYGQPHSHGDAAGFRQEFFQQSPGARMGVRGEKRILTAIAGDTHFRQADKGCAFRPGLGEGPENPGEIPLPIQRGLVEGDGGDAEVHGRVAFNGVRRVVFPGVREDPPPIRLDKRGRSPGGGCRDGADPTICCRARASCQDRASAQSNGRFS